MKAISLWQPWATLIAIGEKCIETRAWPTSYRGEIAIHAAKTREGMIFAYGTQPIRTLLEHAGYTWPGQSVPLGVVVAVAELCDVLRTERIKAEGWLKPKTNAQGVPYWLPAIYELPFGDYGPNRYGWLLRDVRRIDPVPCRGRQALFDLPPDVASAVRERL